MRSGAAGIPAAVPLRSDRGFASFGCRGQRPWHCSGHGRIAAGGRHRWTRHGGGAGPRQRGGAGAARAAAQHRRCAGGPMSALTQIFAVSWMNIRTLPHRLGPSSVVIIGIAGVVAVLISVFAMSTGLVKALQNSGPDDRAILVSTGASAELVSALTNEESLAIADSAGVKKAADGRALASPEALMIVNLFKRDGSEAGAPLRGVTPDGFAVHSEIKMISGRVFRPGVAELIVGKSAQRLYKGLEVGSEVRLRGTTWRVVGTFESGGGAHESELMADAQTLNSAYQRGSVSQSVLVVVDPAIGFSALKDSITTNPQLQVDVWTERG